MSEPFIMTQSKILLPEVSVARTYRTSNGYGDILDLSVYPLVVEELISFGVTKIGIVRGTGIDGIVSQLPEILRPAVALIDPTPQVRQADAMMQTVFDECLTEIKFPETLIYGVSARFRQKTADSNNLLHACCALRFNLLKLLVAAQHQIAVELDRGSCISTISFLQSKLRSPTARASVAILRGVLDSYRPATIESFEVTSSASHDFRNMFQTLLAQEEYRSMAAEAQAMGFPKRVTYALSEFNRSAQLLLRSSPFRTALQYATRMLELVFSIPAPDREHIDQFLGQHYLPPLLPLEVVRSRAQATWLRVNPPPIPVYTIGRDVEWEQARIPGIPHNEQVTPPAPNTSLQRTRQTAPRR
jgi:hypothetical protein